MLTAFHSAHLKASLSKKASPTSGTPSLRLLALIESLEVKGLAHITGGGLVENVPRVLGPHLTAVLDHTQWVMPPLFAWLQQHGNVADAEMHRAGMSKAQHPGRSNKPNPK